MQRETLTAADVETIAAYIGDGFAAFESSPRAAAGGFTLPDDCRAYFVPLDGGRLAQVCAARDAAGRWTLARPSVYRLADYAAAVDGGPAAGDVAAAIESDPRRIVRA